MKKILPWVFLFSAAALFVLWGLMGLKIFSGEYDIVIESYLLCAFLFVCFFCAIYRLLSRRCPHCGKLRQSRGPYCAWCGKKIEN